MTADRKTRNNARQSRIVAWVLCVGGLVFLTAGLYFQYTGWHTRSWPSTPGVISGYRVASVTRPKNYEGYAVQLIYRYSVDGRDFENNQYSTSSATLTAPAARALDARQDYLTDPAFRALQPDMAVVVYYNPQTPAESVLKTGAGWLSWGLLLISVLLLSGAYWEGWRCCKAKLQTEVS